MINTRLPFPLPAMAGSVKNSPVAESLVASNFSSRPGDQLEPATVAFASTSPVCTNPALRILTHTQPAGMLNAPVVSVVVNDNVPDASGSMVTDTPDKLAAGTAIPTMSLLIV